MQDTDTVLLFFTGNPGLASFYRTYLSRVHDTEPSGSLAILACSLLGHSPQVAPVDSKYSNLHMQVEAVVDVLDSVSDTYKRGTKIILAGHSIGSWIILQVRVLLNRCVL